MTPLIEEPYASPFFTAGEAESQHALAEVLKYSRETAGIEARWCWQPLDEYLTPKEAGDVRAIRQLIKAGNRGCCYGPPHDPEDGLSVPERMNLIAGTCVRNHLDARVRTVEDLLDYDCPEQTKDAQILFIPDFCTGPTGFSEGAATRLRSLILDRSSRSRYTVLFISSLTDIEAAFGMILHDHLTNRFLGDPRS